MNVSLVVAAALLAGTLVLTMGWAGSLALRRHAVWENAWLRTTLLVGIAAPVVWALGGLIPAAGWRRVPLVFDAHSFEQRGRQPDRAGPGNTAVATGARTSGRRSTAAPTTRQISKQDVVDGLRWVWMAGAVLSLGRLARGVRSVRRLRRTAQPCGSIEGARMLGEAARTAGVRCPELRAAGGLASPMLIGWRRPCILVPASGDGPTREVLLHELAHLRRGDLWWMTLGRIVGAVWWFYPAAWRIGRRLERSAEDVCDDLVVRWTADAPGYAAQLVTWARETPRERRGELVGAAITGFRSGLGQRVARLLEPERRRRVTIGRSGVAALTAGATLVLGLAAAAGPRRVQAEGLAGAAEARKISEIQVASKGDQPLADDAIVAMSGLRTGGRYTPEAEREAARRLETSERFLSVAVSGEPDGSRGERVQITYTPKTAALSAPPTAPAPSDAGAIHLANIVPGPVAARVNGVEIPCQQVSETVAPRARALHSSLQGEPLAEALDKAWQETVDDLIDRELILQEFARREYAISEDLVTDRVDTIVREEFKGDQAAFIQTLEAQGFTLAKFRQAESDKIVVQAMRFQQTPKVFTGTEAEWKLLSDVEKKRVQEERQRAQEAWLKGMRSKANVQVLVKKSPATEDVQLSQ